MTTDDWLQKSAAKLTQAGIHTGRLDCIVLLEDLLQIDRARILAHPEINITPAHAKQLDAQIERRAEHTPLAYIRGKTEFYGRDFMVNEHVLEPRPESETMIDLLKKCIQRDARIAQNTTALKLADIGSGSGCLGITAALECGIDHIELIDIDATTLDVANQNASTLGVSTHAIVGDLLAEDTTGPYDIVMANLPYVPDNFHINEAAMREPRIAIFGGSDGLELYRRLFGQLQRKSWQPLYIFTESLPPQHGSLQDIAASHGYKLHTSEDFVQVFVPATKSSS